MISTINGGGHVWCYVLPKSACANTNNYFPMADRYSGLIFQHSLANILNVSQSFIKLINKPTKPRGLVCQFPNRQNGNKEAYDSIDAFIHRLKEYIREPIASRYVRDITGMTTIYYYNKKVFLPHQTSNYQCYEQCCF